WSGTRRLATTTVDKRHLCLQVAAPTRRDGLRHPDLLSKIIQWSCAYQEFDSSKKTMSNRDSGINLLWDFRSTATSARGGVRAWSALALGERRAEAGGARAG